MKFAQIDQHHHEIRANRSTSPWNARKSTEFARKSAQIDQNHSSICINRPNLPSLDSASINRVFPEKFCINLPILPRNQQETILIWLWLIQTYFYANSITRDRFGRPMTDFDAHTLDLDGFWCEFHRPDRILNQLGHFLCEFDRRIPEASLKILRQICMQNFFLGL